MLEKFLSAYLSEKGIQSKECDMSHSFVLMSTIGLQVGIDFWALFGEVLLEEAGVLPNHVHCS